jgi:hypothetical protein
MVNVQVLKEFKNGSKIILVNNTNVYKIWKDKEDGPTMQMQDRKQVNQEELWQEIEKLLA